MKVSTYYGILSAVWLAPHMDKMFGLIFGLILGVVGIYLTFKKSEELV